MEQKQNLKIRRSAARRSLQDVGRPLRETAAAIRAHLKRMEVTPTINTETRPGMTRFCGTWAGVAGRYVSVCYISYQGTSNLTRADAEWYLKWLDGGGEGRHYESLRERPTDGTEPLEPAKRRANEGA